MLKQLRKYILLWWLALLPVTLIAAQTEEPLPLDASIAAFSRAFTISYPSTLVEVYTLPRSPFNVTLTNNPDIFTADEPELNAGDVLITVDYGTPASLVLPADGDAYSLAKDYYDLTTETKGELVPVEIGEFTGYEFTSYYEAEAGSFYFWRVFLNAAPEQLVWFTLVTPSQEEQDQLAPTFNAIITSLRLGAVAGEYTEVFKGRYGFTLPYPEGWLVETDAIGSVIVTTGYRYIADVRQPVVGITFGTIGDITGNSSPQSDPHDTAAAIIAKLSEMPDAEIRRLTIDGYPAAMIFAESNVENTFIVILRDEQHFIAATIFTSAGEEQEFLVILIDMLLQATWEGVETAPTP